jgi:hypothetical protein
MKLTQKKINNLFLKAIKDGDVSAVDYLLNDSPVKANLHITNEVGDPAYCLLLACEHNYLPMLKYFLEKTEFRECCGPDVKHGFNEMLYYMYGHAGKHGNLEFISYLMEKLPYPNRFVLFSYAAMENHVHVMDYLVSHKLLSKQDKAEFSNLKNDALKYAITYERQEAFDYLMNYYHQYHNPHHYSRDDDRLNINSPTFLSYAMEKSLEKKNQTSTSFTFFDSFFHHPAILKEQTVFLDNKIFEQMAKTQNVTLYFGYLKKIKSKKLKKEIVSKSHSFSVQDGGKLEDYPIFKKILDDYPSCLNEEARTNIFYALIYNTDREKFHDLMHYDFLVKGTNPNPVLSRAASRILAEDTFTYIKDILQSRFKDKINLYYNDSYALKEMNQEFNNKELIEILQIITQHYPQANKKKLANIFNEHPETIDFINKWTLHDKLDAEIDEPDEPEHHYSMKI